jgi:lipopolysaccharide/colanic/teichoic acid biosynthesis glycosyltransferase
LQHFLFSHSIPQEFASYYFQSPQTLWEEFSLKAPRFLSQSFHTAEVNTNLSICDHEHPEVRLSIAQRTANSSAAAHQGIAAGVSPWRAKLPSQWSRSAGKRLFDCGCVLVALPLLVPAFLAIALAVHLTSSGPVLFLQKRMGWHGRTFTIFKFRTMMHDSDTAHLPVTTAGNQRFTPVGPFLRRWKLDELPQTLNVLLGHMSLVGPRPKLPEHVKFKFYCRPGITGAATIAFAREEMVLDRLPKHHLEAYYHNVVLPAKRRLDADYMAHATFRSDLKLIIDSILRRWDTSVMESVLKTAALDAEYGMQLLRAPVPENLHHWIADTDLNVDRPATAQQGASF